MNWQDPKMDRPKIGRPLDDGGSPLGWSILRKRMWGDDGQPVTTADVLAEWRQNARAVIEGEMR